MLHLLSGGLGLGLIIAALVLAAALDVVDHLRTAAPPPGASGGAVRDRSSVLTAARLWLVVLVAASLVAVLVRIFVVIR